MNIRLALALIGLVIGFVLPTSGQQKDTIDPQIAQQIRALTAKYDAAFNGQDAAALAALYTADGAYTFHGTSHGRQAIEKSYAYDFRSRHPNDHITTVDRMIAVGNEVRSRGRWSASQNDYGPHALHEGYFNWIVVREGDTWKIRRSTISEAFGNSLAYTLSGVLPQ